MASVAGGICRKGDTGTLLMTLALRNSTAEFHCGIHCALKYPPLPPLKYNPLTSPFPLFSLFSLFSPPLPSFSSFSFFFAFSYWFSPLPDMSRRYRYQIIGGFSENINYEKIQLPDLERFVFRNSLLSYQFQILNLVLQGTLIRISVQYDGDSLVRAFRFSDFFRNLPETVHSCSCRPSGV